MIFAAAVAIALMSRPASAQYGSSSLVHTVTVAVPPRVKVQVGSFSPAAPAVRVGSLDASTQGLSLSVNATQAWTLSIAAAPTSSGAVSRIQWSRDASVGYSKLSSSEVTIASGALSARPKAASVYFHNAASGPKTDASKTDASRTALVLTVSAP
ncbi:MAG: hypothetical protein ABI408_11925 [Gemmatimonadaceae bacterium]